jgi:hypothetical protein
MPGGGLLEPVTGAARRPRVFGARCDIILPDPLRQSSRLAGNGWRSVMRDRVLAVAPGRSIG